MPVRHHLFVRERDAGHAYDMTDAEAQAAFPWLQEDWTTFGPFFARPPGGETLADVIERVYAFLQKLTRTMAGKRVLVVTHGGTILALPLRARAVDVRGGRAALPQRNQSELFGDGISLPRRDASPGTG